MNLEKNVEVMIGMKPSLGEDYDGNVSLFEQILVQFY